MKLEQVQPEQYQQQLDRKSERLEHMLAPFITTDITAGIKAGITAEEPVIEVFPSSPEHYRLRAEFRIWHQGDDLFYAMFEPGNKRAPIRVDHCPMVAAPIHELMFELLEAIKASPELSRKLFQVDFLSTLSGELLVTLLYHRPINERWQAEAIRLRQRFGIDVIGRSRKTKYVLNRDFVVERLQLDGRELVYQQVENSFTQPNGAVALQMLQWALDVTSEDVRKEGVTKQDVTGQETGPQPKRDLLELYCGNANFSIALSPNFNRILATEIAKSSVQSAHYNIAANGVDNIRVVRLSSEEFTEAMNGVRPFRRLQEQAIELASYDFSTVLVDPPRAGLDEGTLKLIQRFDRILYISCNPETLCENLRILCQTHRIVRSALFDQFPYTEHMEAGVWLCRG